VIRAIFEASQETETVQSTPVIACGSDKGCETIGMGVIDQSMASLVLARLQRFKQDLKSILSLSGSYRHIRPL